MITFIRLSMKKKKHYISSHKLEELTKELETLTTSGRKNISERLADLHNQTVEELDNPYADVIEDKDYMEKRISEIKSILSNYELIDENANHQIVEIGSKVKVGFESFEDTYEIVDPVEADPINKKISSASPVAKALIGHKVGDVVEVTVNFISHRYRILSIS